jgi:hypothetical protein
VRRSFSKSEDLLSPFTAEQYAIFQLRPNVIQADRRRTHASAASSSLSGLAMLNIQQLLSDVGISRPFESLSN